MTKVLGNCHLPLRGWDYGTIESNIDIFDFTQIEHHFVVITHDTNGIGD